MPIFPAPSCAGFWKTCPAREPGQSGEMCIRDRSQAVPDFAPLLRFLGMMACVYFVGLVSAFFCNYLMAKVSQGTQRSIRDQLFTHMQTLPIRYFDTHPAGDIMSRYTSDIDTLRQMISQAIPQCASSVVTLVVVLITMIITSPILTVLQLITVLAVVFVTKLIAGKSAKFFIGQQRSFCLLYTSRCV